MDAGVKPEFWEIEARRYDRAIPWLNRRFDEMAHAVASSVGGEVLEVAAGTGLVTRRLAPVARRLVATDASPAMLEILRARLAASGFRAEVREADALALPFPDGSFDMVVLANVLHLLPNPKAALSEAKRVVRVGGTICVPTFCHGQNAVARATSRALRLFGFHVVTRFSGDSLADFVQACGLRIRRRARFAGVLPLELVVAELEPESS